LKKKTLTNIEVEVCIKLNCASLTQSSVVRIIHRNIDLKRFFIYLIFAIIVSFCLHLYFTR